MGCIAISYSNLPYDKMPKGSALADIQGMLILMATQKCRHNILLGI